MMSAASIIWEGSVGLDTEVARLRRGDLDALSELLARYQNRLYRYLLRLVRNETEAEDLFQQTWIRVAEKIRRYDPQRSFEAWLFTLARNLAFDHLRRVKPESLDEPRTEDPGSEPRSASLASSERPVLEDILQRERALLLTTAMASLPVIYREVLTLRFEEEMKLEEIARVVEVPLSTVKTRLRRSLESLRRNLTARFPGESSQAGKEAQ
jgi:RNA polymerase sigma-70 factor, ECF subfamily